MTIHTPLSEPGIVTPYKAGSQELIQRQEVTSDVSALDFKTGITSDFDAYDFVVSKLRPGTDNSTLQMRVSNDGGSTFESTSNYYWTTFTNNQSNGTGGSAGAGDSKLEVIRGSIGNGAGEHGGTVYRMHNPTDSGLFTSFSGSFTTAFPNSIVSGFVGGNYSVSETIDAVRFFFDTGNIASGVFELYGLG